MALVGAEVKVPSLQGVQQASEALDDGESVKRNGTAEKRAAFLEELRQKGSVYHAARTAGVGRRTVYTWRNNLPGFAQEWDNAIEDAADDLEASLYERGKAKDTVAAIFWLKGHRPEKYRETAHHILSGDKARPLSIKVITSEEA